MNTRLVGALALVVLALAGCGQPTPPLPTPKPVATNECKALGTDQVKCLADAKCKWKPAPDSRCAMAEAPASPSP